MFVKYNYTFYKFEKIKTLNYKTFLLKIIYPTCNKEYTPLSTFLA